MGDRCYVSVQVAECDVKILQECFGEEGEETRTVQGVSCYGFTDVNYGGTTQLEDLVKKRVPFIAHNSEGGNYGAMVSVFSGRGKMHEHPVDRDHWLTIATCTGRIPKRAILAVARFARRIREVERIMKSRAKKATRA